MTRTSALADGATKRDTRERYLKRCHQLADFYLKRDHQLKHKGCNCSPVVLPVVWAGINSNAHLSLAPIAEIRDLRKQLQSAKGSAVLCVAGADGFCTNVGSYLEFFEPLLTKQLSISLFVFEGNNAYATFDMARILETIKYMKLGHSMDSSEYRYLRRLAQIGLSKDILSMAEFNLKQYLPVDRNCIAIDADATSENTGLFEPDSGVSAAAWLDSTRAAIRRSQAPQPLQHDLFQLELKKASDGAFICPENECSYQGKTVDFVISHIVERIIRYKLDCPLCPESKSFDVLLPACNQHVRDHICRHLTAQVQRHSTAELNTEKLEIVNQDIDLESLRCGRCPGKLFETQKKLKIHWRDNHSAKNVQCDCCGELVTSSE